MHFWDQELQRLAKHRTELVLTELVFAIPLVLEISRKSSSYSIRWTSTRVRGELLRARVALNKTPRYSLFGCRSGLLA